MRKDTILIVLGFAVVAAATFFILDSTVERKVPEIANVVPDEPPVVQEQKAAKDPKAKEVAESGLPPEEKAKIQEKVADDKDSGDSMMEDESAEDGDSESSADAASESGPDTEADAMEADTMSDDDKASEGSNDDADTSQNTKTNPDGSIPTTVTVAPQAIEGGEGEEAADDASSEKSASAEKPESATADKSKSSESSESSSKSAATKPAAEPDIAEPASKGDKIIAKATVNIRAQASTDSEVVGQVPGGETVTVAEDAKDDWAKINHESGNGWVYLPLFKYSPKEFGE